MSSTESPASLAAAVATLESDDDLLNALLAYHEGLLLRQRHPSMAAVAFVAALDGLGKHLATGSRQRFKAAAGLVLSTEEADLLAAAYDLRCSTVHQGALHGGEEFGGVFTMPLFLSRDEGSEFAWGTLRRLESTARAVIVRRLELEHKE